MSAAPINTTRPPADQGPVPIPFLAALMSLAVPGLGQIAQGMLSRNFVRLTKGCLFLVAIWGMFFFGYARSQYRNVYLPHLQEGYLYEDQRAGRINKSANLFGRPMPTFLGNLWNRPQYIMQFFAGAPAWPALWNYFVPDMPIFGKVQVSPGSVTKKDVDPNGARQMPVSEDEIISLRNAHARTCEEDDNKIQQEMGMGRMWDIYWIYTVIAGALNIMVVYDAFAGPVRFKEVKKKPGEGKK